MAFAGFSPGEAEGLRRAMSRKRSAAAIDAYHQRFVDGALRPLGRRRRGARRARLHDDRRLLGLRVPEGPRRGLRPARLPVDVAAGPLRARVPRLAARRAAHGLLPARRPGPRGPAPRHPGPAPRRQRQRRRLRRRRRARVRRPRRPGRRPAATGCSRRRGGATGAAGAAAVSAAAGVRLGLGHVLGVRGDEVAALVEARRSDGPFGTLDDLVARAGAGRPALERLAWSGACDALATTEGVPPRAARRVALWRLGVAATAHKAGRAPSSPSRSRCRRRPPCPRSGAGRRWWPTTRRPA